MFTIQINAFATKSGSIFKVFKVQLTFNLQSREKVIRKGCKKKKRKRENNMREKMYKQWFFELFKLVIN